MISFRLRYCFLVVLSVYLTSCMKPQILHPMSAGFSPNEYLVVQEVTKSRLGQLYQAIQEVDKDGKNIPLRWEETPLLIFPQGVDANSIEEISVEQTRNVVETSDSSGKLTAATFVSINGERKTAFKYQSKASNFLQLKLPLSYNPNAKEYMSKKLKDNPNYRFAYLAALYEGTAFVEVLNSVDTSGGGNYAAFQLEGKYYTTTNTGIINTGAIIYRLLPVNLDQLSEKIEPKKQEEKIEREKEELAKKVEPERKKFSPLSPNQLDEIITSMPEEIRHMIKPQ